LRPFRVKQERLLGNRRLAEKVSGSSGNPSHEDNGGFLADSAIEAEMKEAIARSEKYNGYTG
jgi:hypothetical protein